VRTKIGLKFFFFFILCFVAQYAYSAFEDNNNAVLEGVSSFYNFSPSHYFQDKSVIFASSGSRLYSMSECNLVHTGFLLSFSSFFAGTDISFFGSSLYNEMTIDGLFLAGRSNLFGVNIKFMKLGIEGYSSTFYLGNDFLFISQNDFFNFQAIYNNAISYGYRYESEKPVSKFTSLVKIYPAEWNSLNIQISYTRLGGTIFEMGSGARLSSVLSAGVGFSLVSRSIYTNFIFSLGRFDLSYDISIHPELGLTHSVGIIYAGFKNISKNILEQKGS